jgi:hypothetical protein
MIERIKNPNKTPKLQVPFLTEEQKTALFEREDHGITPVEGIPRYPAFDDWMGRGNHFGGVGVNGKNNFSLRFLPNQYLREAQHFQRFILLYPELVEELETITETHYGVNRTGKPGEGVTEEEEYKYWEAYEKLAVLVDADDDPMVIANDLPLPRGMVIPDVLTG